MTKVVEKRASGKRASGLTRRKLLRNSAAAAGVVAVGSLGFPHIAQAKPEKLIIPDAGGDLRDAYVKSHYQSFTAKTGIEVSPVAYMGIAQVKALVENQAWGQADLIAISAAEAAIAGLQGLVEPMDYGLINKAPLIPQAAHEYWVMTLVAASLIAWNTNVYNRETAPQSWPEFFDIASPPKFTGPRGLWKNATLVMDMAAMGDGVAKDDLYPLDINRSLNALQRIRDNIYWWEHGAQSAQLLIDNEVDFEFAWNGRVYGPKTKGAPVDFHFNQAVLDGDALIIPKGHPNKKWSMEFIAHMMTAEPQAELARHIPYGPTNIEGNLLLSPEVFANLPASPDSLPHCVFQDVGWWAENGQTAYDGFNEWLLG
jgi:putative spermidine/putrescine transport system substrate-binding protein